MKITGFGVIIHREKVKVKPAAIRKYNIELQKIIGFLQIIPTYAGALLPYAINYPALLTNFINRLKMCPADPGPGN